ncbi:MAG: glycosyltransferase [Bryobacteraceae bacterium]|nr:glycosyltransferase [Bryobacteraceae bacterium]
MQHTVLSVAYPLTSVGPDAVGGSEQVLSLLDRALKEAGHRSLVLAAEGSQVFGEHLPSPAAAGHLDDKIRAWGRRVHGELIRDTLQRYPVDLIHMHSLDFHAYVPGGSLPVLSTLHLPPDWYPPQIFQWKRERLYLNCVSDSQRSQCPPSSLLLPTISNGIEVQKFTVCEKKKNFALALGRICPEKAFERALRASRRARVEAILAGELFPYPKHREYFRREITPLLDARRRFIGPLTFSRKRKLLSEARCLLVSSTVAETSSLVAMEALASGTPVVAFRAGALGEIVEHGRTGFLVDSIEEMAEAIRDVRQLNPVECRRSAEQRFNAANMIRSYLDLYDQLIRGSRHGDFSPQRRSVSGASFLVAR